MKKVLHFVGVLCGCILAVAAARAGGNYVQVDYPASTAVGELQIPVTYTLWIPDGVATLRGIVVHQHGAGILASQQGATAAYDLHWQALAAKYDCALLGPSYHVPNNNTDASPGGSEWWFDPRRGSEKVFLRALHDLAEKSKHSEVETVPWVLWGHSGGGIWSNVMATLHPDRVAAIWFRSGTAVMFGDHPEFAPVTVPDAFYGIPMMTNAGVKEKGKGPWSGSIAAFETYRGHGTSIGFAPDPRTGHWCGDSRYLAIPFLDACMAMRLPEKGAKDQTLRPVDNSQAWFADEMSETAVPAAEYKGDPKKAVWLPNGYVAKCWMEYVKYGIVADFTPPAAPTEVVVKWTAAGNDITWQAAVDYESGLSGFIVVRDGKALARLPQNAPTKVFGRPLFQGISHGDTPDATETPMHYIDATAKKDEKHVYTVVSLNGMNTQSEPSAPYVDKTVAPMDR